MRGGEKYQPIDIINMAKQSGVQPREIFYELANRMTAKRLADIYTQRLLSKWREGQLGPKLFNSKVEAIETVLDGYQRFVKAVLDDNILRSFNSPPKKIESARDWADAVETLYGFQNYYEQAIFSKEISQRELEDLEMFCNQYTGAPMSCVSPCDMVGKGFFKAEKKCSVKGKKVDIKGRSREPIIVKGIAFRK